jgi:Ca-activated chloride channel homolog
MPANSEHAQTFDSPLFNPQAFDASDPRWTAYALGELTPAEREACDRVVAASPEARAWLAELSALSTDLASGLGGEVLPALTTGQRESVVVACRVPAEGPVSEASLASTIAIPPRNGGSAARAARWRMWGASIAMTVAIAGGVALLPRGDSPSGSRGGDRLAAGAPARDGDWLDLAWKEGAGVGGGQPAEVTSLGDREQLALSEVDAANVEFGAVRKGGFEGGGFDDGISPVAAGTAVAPSKPGAAKARYMITENRSAAAASGPVAAASEPSSGRPLVRRAAGPAEPGAMPGRVAVTASPPPAAPAAPAPTVLAASVPLSRSVSPQERSLALGVKKREDQSKAVAAPADRIGLNLPARGTEGGLGGLGAAQAQMGRSKLRGVVADETVPEASAAGKPANRLNEAEAKLPVVELQKQVADGKSDALGKRQLSEQLARVEAKVKSGQGAGAKDGLRRESRDAAPDAKPDDQLADLTDRPGLVAEKAAGDKAAGKKDAEGDKSGEMNVGQAQTEDRFDFRLQQLQELQVAEREAVQLPALQQVEALNQIAQLYDERVRQSTEGNTEAYDVITDNPFQQALGETALSTFAIDVDTAAYTNLRRYLNGGSLPPRGAIRIEELINYFPYSDAGPTDGSPFTARIEIAECPWQPQHRLVRVALKGREIAVDQRPVSNLVFLVDVSGSMQDENKLPLVREGLRMLVNQLGENDRVAIVVYAGASGLVLPSTSATNKQVILSAIDNLQAGGSTNGGAGIELAYKTALENFIKGGANRVILCTDGDFNVGVTSRDELVRLVEEKAKANIFATILGFGMGNLKDSTLEQLADKGNGQYGYIDSLAEARKQFVDQLSGTLVTIAKDVKIQLEFNPAKVAGYRLIGYENRVMANQDFRNDAKDAGEIGAGHSVTALYELIPAGQPVPQTAETQTLKYQVATTVKPDALTSTDWLTLRLRHKAPEGETASEQEFVATDSGARFGEASVDFRWSAAVASFGMVLRDSPYKGMATLPMVKELAESAKGADAAGYRAEFVGLVQKAAVLLGQ